MPLLTVENRDHSERLALEQYLSDGGTLLGDACCGRKEFMDAFMVEMRKLFPKRPLDRLEMKRTGSSGSCVGPAVTSTAKAKTAARRPSALENMIGLQAA